MKRKAITILALLYCTNFVLAQSPYQLKPKKESVIIGTGLAFGGAAYFLNKKMPVLTEAQIIDFENENINFFEVSHLGYAHFHRNPSFVFLYWSDHKLRLI